VESDEGRDEENGAKQNNRRFLRVLRRPNDFPAFTPRIAERENDGRGGEQRHPET